MRRSIGIGVFVAAAVCAGAAQAQSFNCRYAHFADEKLICAEPELGRLDERLNAVFNREMKGLSRSESKALDADEDDWVVSRRKCGSNYQCIVARYRERIAELSDTDQDDQAAPARSRSAARDEPSDRQPAKSTRARASVGSRDSKPAAKPDEAPEAPAARRNVAVSAPPPAPPKESRAAPAAAPKNPPSAERIAGVGSSQEPQLPTRRAPPAIKWVDPLPDR